MRNIAGIYGQEPRTTDASNNINENADLAIKYSASFFCMLNSFARVGNLKHKKPIHNFIRNQKLNVSGVIMLTTFANMCTIAHGQNTTLESILENLTLVKSKLEESNLDGARHSIKLATFIMAVSSFVILASINFLKWNCNKTLDNALVFIPNSELMIDFFKSRSDSTVVKTANWLGVPKDPTKYLIGIWFGHKLFIITNISGIVIKIASSGIDVNFSIPILLTVVAALVQLLPVQIIGTHAYNFGISDGLLSNAFITATISVLLTLAMYFLLLKYIIINNYKQDFLRYLCSKAGEKVYKNDIQPKKISYSDEYAKNAAVRYAATQIACIVGAYSKAIRESTPYDDISYNWMSCATSYLEQRASSAVSPDYNKRSRRWFARTT